MYNIVTSKATTTKAQQKIIDFSGMENRDIIYVSTGNTTTTKTVSLIYTAVLTDVHADGPNRLKTVQLVKPGSLIIEYYDYESVPN